MTRLVHVSLTDDEREGCLQSEGGKDCVVERSVVSVMLSRNPEGPQDLSKP